MAVYNGLQKNIKQKNKIVRNVAWEANQHIQIFVKDVTQKTGVMVNM